MTSNRSKRWKHFVAMSLIGDGVMAIIRPKYDAIAWTGGPRAWKSLMHELHRRPTLTRMIGAAQIAAAVYWSLSHEDSE